MPHGNDPLRHNRPEAKHVESEQAKAYGREFDSLQFHILLKYQISFRADEPVKGQSARCFFVIFASDELFPGLYF